MTIILGWQDNDVEIDIYHGEMMAWMLVYVVAVRVVLLTVRFVGPGQ